MHYLIKQLLEKRGIEKLEDLTIQEKVDFDRWNKILVQEPITLENLTDFITEQKEKMENKIAGPDISKEKRLECLPYLTIYKALLGLIREPQVAKEQTEKYLKQLLE